MSSKYTTHDYISEKILKARNREMDIAIGKEFTALKRQIIIDSILNTRENQEYYDKFIERVKDEKYFNISHINELGLEYDICIFLSKKGIGKSYYMIQQCNEVVDSGGDIAIMRVTDEDRIVGLSRQLIDYNAHFSMDAKGNLVHNTQKVPDPKNTEKLINRPCGIAFSLTTCLKIKGGGFPKTKLMIFDEASDKRKGVGVKHYEDFIVSVANSVEREKNVETTTMPWIVYGNTDFESSHPLFEAFQIDPDTNLCYVKRQPEGANRPCKILYINSRGLYRSGAANSIFIGSIGNVQRAMSAFINEACNLTNKVLALDLTVLAEPYICIVFTHLKERWNVRVAKYDHEVPGAETETWYFVAVSLYNPAYCYGYDTYTSESVTADLYSHLMDLRQDLEEEWEEIKEIIDSHNTFFIGWESADIVAEQIKKNVKDDNILWD